MINNISSLPAVKVNITYTNNVKQGLIMSNFNDCPWYILNNNHNHIVNNNDKKIYNAYFIGIKNKYIIIDVDTKEGHKEFKKLNLTSYFRTKSFSWNENENKYKFHYWFKVNNKLRNIKTLVDTKKGIDLITDKILELREEYERIIKTEFFGDIELQEPFLKRLNINYSYETNIDKYNIDNYNDKGELIKKEVIKKEIKEIKENNEVNKNDYKYIIALLNILNDDYYVEYEPWRNVMFALKSSCNIYDNEKIYKIALKFSKQYNKFNIDEFNKFWYNINIIENGKSLKSLHYYAYLCNEEATINTDKKYGKLKIIKNDNKIINEQEIENKRNELIKNVVEEMNKQLFITTDNGAYYKINNTEVSNLKYEQLDKIYNNKILSLPRYNKPDEKIKYLKLWNEAIDRREYNNIIFNPDPNYKDNNYYNTFKGFKYLDNKLELDINKYNTLLNHIKFIFGEHHEFILNWLTWILQRPHIKTNIAVIIMTATMGVGKDMLLSIFDRLFNIYSTKINSIADFENKFNNNFKDRLLIYGSEIKALKKDISDELKDIITREKFALEQKAKDVLGAYNDYANYIFTTNNDYTIRISEGDRRYFVINAPEYKKDDTYYQKLRDDYNNDECMKHLFNYLYRRDINNIIKLVPPETNIKTQTINNNLPSYIEFIYYSAINETLFEKDKPSIISLKDYLDLLDVYCRTNNKSTNYNKNSITSRIIEHFKNQLIKKEVKRHVVYYSLPSLENAIEILKKHNPEYMRQYMEF